MTSKQLERLSMRGDYISISRDKNNKVDKLVRIKGGKMITHKAKKNKSKVGGK